MKARLETRCLFGTALISLLAVVALAGCYSSWESELLPLAHTLSSASDPELEKVGVKLPTADTEFEITYQQAQLLVPIIESRTKRPHVRIDPDRIKLYRIFAKRCEKEIIKLRKENGAGPYYILIFIADSNGSYDRKTSPFVSD